MRILVVNAFYPPLTTGSAHFSHDVAKQYQAAGHDVMVITAQPVGAPSREVVDGIDVRRVPARWIQPGKLSFNYSIPFSLLRGGWRAIRKSVDDFQPDVIHQNGQFFDLTLVTSVIAWRRRIPRILTVHTPLTHTNTAARLLISAVDRTVLRAFVRLGTSRVFAVDRFTMEMCQRRYRPRRHAVEFLPATLDPYTFDQGDPTRVRNLLELQSKKVILSFGHVIPIRSRKLLIRALPAILEVVPNAVVLVVGQVYDTQFIEIAEELGVREHVLVVGRVPHFEVPDYLAAADVECHELDGHGIGITSFEVMAAGVPIVANAQRDVFPGINLDDWPLIRIGSYSEPATLAREVCSVLTADLGSLRATISQQSNFVHSNFAADVVAKRYLDVMAQLANART